MPALRITGSTESGVTMWMRPGVMSYQSRIAFAWLRLFEMMASALWLQRASIPLMMRLEMR